MSYMRITEFTGHPKERQGEWYAPEGREGCVRLERGEAALGPWRGGAGHVATVWTGVRTYQCGSEQKGPLVYLLKYPVPETSSDF